MKLLVTLLSAYLLVSNYSMVHHYVAAFQWVSLLQWSLFIIALLILTVSLVASHDEPLLGMWLARYFQYTLIAIRVSYAFIIAFIAFVAYVGPAEWVYYYGSVFSEFGLDGCSISLQLQYSGTLTNYTDHIITSMVDLIIPTALAEEHSSFDTFMHDTTPGGVLISGVIKHIHSQNRMGIDLFLTPHGINHTTKLVTMLNALASNLDNKFSGDAVLLDFLSKSYQYPYNFNVDLTSSEIKPLISYDIPLTNRMMMIDGMNSGVYYFASQTTSDIYLGSALAFRIRLKTHMDCFSGVNTSHKTYLHDWVNTNVGLPNMKWAHLIDMPNLSVAWSRQNPTLVLSKGGANILTAFAQLPIRVLEQCMFTYFKPTLQPGASTITFFNMKLTTGDLALAHGTPSVYQAVDLTRTIVYAQENSYNKLGNVLGVSDVTIRKNLNWHKPMVLPIDGLNLSGYVQEIGAPIRTQPVAMQLKPNQKYPLVELDGRTLYDLTPGLIHVVDPVTLKDVYTFESEAELWTTLNPTLKSHVESLETRQRYQYLGSRVSIYINAYRESGNTTELGTFLYCRHPEILTKFKIIATPFFAVTMATGSCVWYLNNNQVPGVSSSTVTRNRSANKVTSKGLRFVNADIFVQHYPDAVNKPGSTYQLNKTQLTKLPMNPKRVVGS